MPEKLTVLHVYAGPFPTRQGTQVLVDAICRESSDDGVNTHLLCYDGGSDFKEALPFAVHRIAALLGSPPLRSGPSFGRLPRDILLAAACRRLIRQLRPDILHAHHYEALVACALARGRASRPTLVFHCHALLGYELDTYFPKPYAAQTRSLGSLIDTHLPRLADAVAGVSPFVTATMRNRTQGRIAVDYVPAYVEPLLPAGRQSSSSNPQNGSCVTGLYTGNLDGYQEISRLLDALERLPLKVRKRLRFLFSTSSLAASLKREISQRGLADIVRIQKENTAREAAFALETADFTVIPRSRPGGIPIKLINALGAGVACIVDRHIACQLLDPCEAMFAHSEDPEQLCAAITALTESPQTRRSLQAGGLRCYQREFSKKAARDARRLLYERVLAKKAAASHR